MYPMNNQGPQIPNLDYMGLANGNQQVAARLQMIAGEIIKYFGFTNGNYLKEVGSRILANNNFINNEFVDLLLACFDKAIRANVVDSIAVMDTASDWLSILMTKHQDLWGKIDAVTANKVINTLRNIMPSYVPPMQNNMGYGQQPMQNNMGYANQQVPPYQPNSPIYQTNNINQQNRRVSVNDVVNRYPDNQQNQNNEMISNRFPSQNVSEVNSVNRNNHQINPVPTNPVTRPSKVTTAPIVNNNENTKVNVINCVPETLDETMSVKTTVMSMMEDNAEHMLDNHYGMAAVYTEALSITPILTKQIGYDNVFEYIENIIVGKSNKQVRYPISYEPFVKMKSAELTKITNKILGTQSYMKIHMPDFIEDFNELVTLLQKQPVWGADFCEQLVCILNNHLTKTMIHIVEVNEDKENEDKTTKTNVDMIGRVVRLLIVNKSSEEFEDFYGKSQWGLADWLDNVDDWFELLIVTTDSVVYSSSGKGDSSLNKIGLLI